MGDIGFPQKTDSGESDGISVEIEQRVHGPNKDVAVSASCSSLIQQRSDSDNWRSTLNLDLNVQPEVEEAGNGIVFVGDFDSGSRVTAIQTENSQSTGFLLGIDLRRTERDPDDDERPSSSSKRKKFSFQEKGKAKVDDRDQPLRVDIDGDRNLEPDFEKMQIDILSSSSESEQPVVEQSFVAPAIGDGLQIEQSFLSKMEGYYESRRKEEARRYHEIARSAAKSLARYDNEEDLSKYTKQEKEKAVGEAQDDPEDFLRPFGIAMDMIKKQNSNGARKKHLSSALEPEFLWVPANNKGNSVRVRRVPSLLDLSLTSLARNAEAMVSLEYVPDELRHKLSQVLCDTRKMDAHFLELLATGSPTEIRVSNCSTITEQEFIRIFANCDTKNLNVLQLDLSGPCISDCVLNDTIAQSPNSLPALAAMSLRGAYQLSDHGLITIADAAPALQSVNLSQCSLITSAGIYFFSRSVQYNLRELYLDECSNIQSMAILPALRLLTCLEVLSMAGIQSVSDDFVTSMVQCCGQNMKELVFANCVQLTDRSIKSVGETCSRLLALDLSYLQNLTDLAMKYLTNGCRSIHRLKLCRNSFSDEAIAAFLEASGGCLNELSLNNVRRVGLNTALSLAKRAKTLLSLDLSWCRNLTDEALGLIVDSCLSLRLLKLFGCTQVTDVFLNGHSNSQVQIVGLKMTPLAAHLNVLDELETLGAPLRYSPLDNFIVTSEA